MSACKYDPKMSPQSEQQRKNVYNFLKKGIFTFSYIYDTVDNHETDIGLLQVKKGQQR